MSNTWFHLKALLKKNWILFKRSKTGSCCELFVPIVFALILLYIRTLVKKEDIDTQSYYQNATVLYSTPQIDPTLYDIVNKLPSNDSTGRKDDPFVYLFASQSMKNCYLFPKGGFIGLSPKNEITKSIEEKFINYYPKPFTMKYFNSNEEIDDYVTSEDYGTIDSPYLCLAIHVDIPNDGSLNYEYRLRFNVTGGDQEVFSTLFNPKTIPFVKESFTDSIKYINTGYLVFQTWLDNAILKRETPGENYTITPQIASVKVEAHLKDDLGRYMQQQTNVFLVLPLILPYLRMIFRLLYEKEKKIREGMKMMGMNNFSFYFSWIITYFIIYTIICLINASLLTWGFFTYSNWFFIFLFLWIFCIVLIFQSLFVSVFFSRVKAGIIGGIIFFFILYIINVIIANNNGVSSEVKKQASLSSHAAVSFAADTLLLLETQQTGLNSDTVGSVINNYCFKTYFLFEFYSLLIFSILSLYLDQVFPNEFGQKKSPLFFLDCFFKNKKQKTKPKESQFDPLLKNIEDENEYVEQVDSNLKQQEIESQALLIKNLSKTYSNGKKAVIKLNLKMYKGQIFVLLGHNGAGKTTTLSILTGLLNPTSGTAEVLGLDILKQMSELRKNMGVCPQHDILFETLTVQEHLELFASFKGMNPSEIQVEVAKIIDDVDLKSKKDDLAKNLSGGQKRRLSVGIAFIGNSRIILLDEPTSGMDTSARRYIWEMLKNYKNDRIVILTTHFMDEADFLGDRIGIMGDGLLKCCGSSVFLKNKFGVGYNLTIVKNDTQTNPEIKNFVQLIIPDAKCLSEVSAEIAFQLPLHNLPQFKQLFLELDENLEKLGIATYGISITTLEEVFLRVAEGASDLAPHHSVEIKYSKKLLEEEKSEEEFDLKSVKEKRRSALFFIHFWAILVKRFQYFKRDKRGLCCEIFLPAIIVVIGLCLTFIKFVQDAPMTTLSPTELDVPINLPIPESYNTFFNNNFVPHKAFDFELDNTSSIRDFDNFVFDSRYLNTDGLYGAVFLNNDYNNVQNKSYLLLYNSTTPFTLPIFINEMNQAMIRNLTGKNISIRLIDDPFPLTKKFASLSSTANGFIAIFVFAVAMAFIPASLIVYIVKEKETNVKHQHLVSGMGLSAYWISNYVVDFIKLLFPVIFAGLMCKAFGIDALTNPSDSWGAIWLIFFFFATCTISFTYLVSFAFKDYGNAQAFNFVFFFLMSILGSLLIFVLKLIPSSRNAAKAIQFILRIFPPFCLGFGILNISNRELYSIIENYPKAKDAFDSDIALWDILYLLIFTPVYFILIFVVEKLLTIPKVLQIFSKENSVLFENIKYDSDVEKEMEKIYNTSPQDYTVYVKDLRKVYMLDKNKYKVAVTKSSFGIKNGDCFALLGVNGAGKTTTFKMLCGEIPPTSGNAYVAGFDITTQLDSARENIGYCPQFDALLENLTAKEHLFLYAAIKGVPSQMRAALVESKLQELNLKKYENVCAGTYSGGNKRKLSVALALLGNPPIVFLDEPSTGMDPKARRFMWDVINRISTLRKQSSIILTTHSMEEAEALATRLTIMVNGTLKCLGSVQHIKNKFGKGYEIEIKTTIPDTKLIDSLLDIVIIQRGTKIYLNQLMTILKQLNKSYLIDRFVQGKSAGYLELELKKISGLAIEVLLEFIIIEDYGDKIIHSLNEEFTNVNLIEHFQSFYRFKLNSDISVGKVFGWFETNKSELNISQYSIKQATIEQIFNVFAEEQENEDAHKEINQGEVPEIVVNRKASSLMQLESESFLYKSSRKVHEDEESKV